MYLIYLCVKNMVGKFLLLGPETESVASNAFPVVEDGGQQHDETQ